MGRLIRKDKNGNWHLKVVPWERLRAGAELDKATADRIYGALCKLLAYEDTELEPAKVVELNDFEKTQCAKVLEKLAEEREKHRWIPVEERLPESKSYILLSFANFDLPLVGRYEQDEDGGAFYIGDEDITCVSQGVFVNAWLPLPEPYRPEKESDENGT